MFGYIVHTEVYPGCVKSGMHGALHHSISHTSVYRGLHWAMSCSAVFYYSSGEDHIEVR